MKKFFRRESAKRPGLPSIWRFGAHNRYDREELKTKIRKDRRTKDLLKRIKPGEIAIIDHEDLDRLSAEGLIEMRVGAVVNVASFSTGKYPNAGPFLLHAAGIPMLEIDEDIFDSAREGQAAALVRDTLWCGSEPLAQGRVLTGEEIEARLFRSKESLSETLEKFALNTLDYLRKEKKLLIDELTPPSLETELAGRQVMVVVRGPSYKEDLNILRDYVREVRPVLVGVDGGADALVEAGYKPDIIIGDMDSVSDAALRSRAELVLHAYQDGDAPGLRRLEHLGLEAEIWQTPGTSEDIALLLAYEKGAELIVAVGSHANLIDFLDKGRQGMASTFLTRLKVGSMLVDAKGVSQLYRRPVRMTHILLIVLAALVVTLAILIAVASPPALRELLLLFREKIRILLSF